MLSTVGRISNGFYLLTLAVADLDWLAFSVPPGLPLHDGWQFHSQTDTGVPYVIGQVSTAANQSYFSASFDLPSRMDLHDGWLFDPHAPPVVILTVVSDSEDYPWLIPRLERASSYGFTGVLQSSSDEFLSGGQRTIAYLVIPQGEGTIGGRGYEAFVTSEGLRGTAKTFFFDNQKRPRVFGTSSVNGRGPCSLMKKHVTDYSVTLWLSEPTMCGASGEHARDESVSLLVMEGAAELSTYGELAFQVGSLAWPEDSAPGTSITGNLSQWLAPAFIGGASHSRNVIVFPGVSPKLAGVGFTAAGLHWNATNVNVSLHDDSYCPFRRERTTEKTDYQKSLVIAIAVGAASAVAACIAMVVAYRCFARRKQAGALSNPDAVIGTPVESPVIGTPVVSPVMCDNPVTEGVPLGAATIATLAGAKDCGEGLDCSSVIVGMPVLSFTSDEPVTEGVPLGDAQV
jgi:hypothetical protein